MQEQPAVTTFLFTDIEGSTRLWEEQPGRMGPALARHDAIGRGAVEGRGGVVVKTTGDGLHAAFGDPLGAVGAAVEIQQSLAKPEAGAIALSVRCGMHVGVVERRDNDFFGSAVNRAARIMSAAHGGQVLLSQPVAELVSARLPPDVTLRDLGLVRLRDLSQPERIYQVVHPALRDSFPALRSLEGIPNNLPQQVASFVGRERELAETRKLLGSARLLTIVGTGGLGKTRLALQAAAEMLDDFRDGVWFVELASLADPQLVPQAVASVLGVKEESGTSVMHTLIRHCSDRRILLLLDNCEHLVGACAEFAARLLQSAKQPKMLATSRERLNIRGETTYPLAPLAVPDPTSKPTLAALAQSDAVRLFIDRVAAARPSFEVTDDNAPIIADICHRLDGIPLAIELAAARARALSVETIAARLNDRFRLLTTGDRAALPRQQTLRALIDWSHELLSAPERALLRRLSVFAGGFTLEDAEAITPDAALDRGDVLDLLAHLVEKSLVVLDVDGSRYRLLETVREYAAERLDASGEARDMRNRHLRHYVALAETATPQLFGPAQGEWLARLDLERENILAAHAWCAHADDGAELGLRLVSMKFYWINRGLPGLGYRLAVEALARTRGDDRSVLRSRALFETGQMACYMGRYRDGQAHLEESLSIARALGNVKRIGSALQPLGLACLGQGDVAGARSHLEEALALARKDGSKHDLASALNAMAQLHRTQNDLEAAIPLYEQVLRLARETGDRETIAIGLLNLSMARIGAGAAEEVPRMLLEVLEAAAAIRSRTATQSALEVSAGLAASRGEWARAARFFGVAEAQAETTGLHRDPADEGFLSPLVARAREALGEQAFRVAEAQGRAVDHDEATAEVRAWLGGAASVRDGRNP